MGSEKKGKEEGWMSVPAFGEWDMQHGIPDYSMDFSKIRENRKQNKRDVSRVSVGNEDELVAPRADRGTAAAGVDDVERTALQTTTAYPPPTRKKMWSCLPCCMSA